MENTELEIFKRKAKQILAGRELTTTEFFEYVGFMESMHFEPGALLFVMQECVNLKGCTVGYAYILTVAKNLVYEGLTTHEAVENYYNKRNEMAAGKNSSILEKINDLVKKNNLSHNKVAVDCGLQSNSFSYWKNGKAKPSLDAVIKIADYFGVSIDYLVGRETPAQNNVPQTTKNITLDPNMNNEHLALWQQLDEEQQVEVNGIIKGMLLAQKKMEAK